MEMLEQNLGPRLIEKPSNALPLFVDSESHWEETVSHLAALSHEGTGFDLLCVASDSGNSDFLLKQAMNWVERESLDSTYIALQGAQIVWSDRRVAILAPLDRLQSVKAVVVEVHSSQAQLNDIEKQLERLWPQLNQDLPTSFELESRGLKQSSALKERYVQAFSLHARLLRLAPQILRPHVYPPTLASQVGERSRERLRLTERHSILCDQLEGVQRIYEGCATRVNDLKIAQRGHFYEKVIIALLILQVLHGIWLMME